MLQHVSCSFLLTVVLFLRVRKMKEVTLLMQTDDSSDTCMSRMEAAT